MTPRYLLLPTFVVAAALAACATPGADAPTASAKLEARSGSHVTGTVRFVQKADQLVATVEVSGLNPGQEHGFHIHDKGDCSAADGMSAGGHFNPTSKPHGPQHADHHSGDMPALKADAYGVARGSFTLHHATLTDGPTQIVGRSVIVHKDPDDYKTQPTGNSGARWACGVIVR